MYKGEEEFNTNLGGVASILTFILLIIYAGQQIVYLWLEPEFLDYQMISHTDYASNEDSLVISTNEDTLATVLSYVGDTEGVDVSSIARIQFYSAVGKPGESGQTEFTYEWHSAKLCDDLYSENLTGENAKFYESEFGGKFDWVCPDLDEIEVYNNAFLYREGRNFVMVVNDCTLAE